jgi:RluA family pseudouridine synthase
VDDHILVVDKPAGLPVLPDGWEKDSPYAMKMLEDEFGRVFIVHRLDKITSGVMVFAREAESHRALSMQFEAHIVEKVYHAIVEGNPPWDEKTAKHPLRINVGHKHRTAVDNRKGKPSETRFRVLKRYPARVEWDRSTALIEAMPMTGRTHQVRVHAYALGHPLVGDILYGAQNSDVIARPALHALSLTFNHPLSNEKLTFKTEYPQDFDTALKLL